MGVEEGELGWAGLGWRRRRKADRATGRQGDAGLWVEAAGGVGFPFSRFIEMRRGEH